MTKQEVITTLRKYLLCHSVSTPEECPHFQCEGCEYDFNAVMSDGTFDDAIEFAVKELENPEEKKCGECSRRKFYQTGYRFGESNLAKDLINKLDKMRAKPMELKYDVPLIDSIIEMIKKEID